MISDPGLSRGRPLFTFTFRFRQLQEILRQNKYIHNAMADIQTKKESRSPLHKLGSCLKSVQTYLRNMLPTANCLQAPISSPDFPRKPRRKEQRSKKATTTTRLTNDRTESCKNASTALSKASTAGAAYRYAGEPSIFSRKPPSFARRAVGTRRSSLMSCCCCCSGTVSSSRRLNRPFSRSRPSATSTISVLGTTSSREAAMAFSSSALIHSNPRLPRVLPPTCCLPPLANWDTCTTSSLLLPAAVSPPKLITNVCGLPSDTVPATFCASSGATSSYGKAYP